jgi:hypothetical protein
MAGPADEMKRPDKGAGDPSPPISQVFGGGAERNRSW